MLVVGLGNPGKKYDGNRHNVGFMVVDALRAKDGLPDWREKFSGVFTKGDRYALLKPMTFMNLSGDSLQPAAAFLKEPPGDVVVVHDELDLPWKDVRIKVGGGHAGHNGLRSIIQRLGTPEFVRVRVGIGRPPAGFRGDVADYVLQDFDAMEKAELPSVVDEAVRAVEAVLKAGAQAAMNAQNTRGNTRKK